MNKVIKFLSIRNEQKCGRERDRRDKIQLRKGGPGRASPWQGGPSEVL